MNKSLIYLSTFAAACFCLLGPAVSAARADDVTELRLNTTRYLYDGALDHYEFSVELEATGLDWAHLDTPVGQSQTRLDLTPDGVDLWEFTSQEYNTLAALRADYPLGEYSLAVSYDSARPPGLQGHLAYDVADDANNMIRITVPADGAMDISPTPTCQWTDSSGFADVLWTGIYDEQADEDIYDEVILDTTAVDWSPVLVANKPYDLWAGAGWGDLNLTNDSTLLSWPGGDDAFIYRAIFGVEDEVRFTTIPEPATLSLLALGGLAMLRRRRKA